MTTTNKKANLNRLLIALIFGLCLTVFGMATAKADAVSPDEKFVDYCVKVNNLSNFSDYTFMARDTIRNKSDYNVINDGACVNSFQYGGEFMAIKKSDVPATGLPENLSPSAGTFLQENSKIVRNKTLPISRRFSMNKNSPVEQISETWEISQLDATKLEVKPVSITYTYKGGVTETKPFTDPKFRPVASGTVPNSNSAAFISNTPDWTWVWYAVVPVVALLAIAAMLIFRQPRLRK